MDSWLRQSQEQAETVSDRMVTVTVDARGRLVDLKLTREATDLFPSDLATTILDCVDKARSRAGAKASKIASDWMRISRPSPAPTADMASCRRGRGTASSSKSMWRIIVKYSPMRVCDTLTMLTFRSAKPVATAAMMPV